MKKYWLLKSDPEEYSYDDLERDGKTVWDGVTNNLALQHMRQIKKGDALIIYHTGTEKAIVGLAEATSNPYPDPQAASDKIVALNIKAKRRARRPILLAEIKERSEFAGFALVRLPRLSVMPVSATEWATIAQMAGL